MVRRGAYDGCMATSTRKTKAAPIAPLRDVVAANLRAIIAAKQVKIGDLSERIHRPRQWVHRRTFGLQEITTQDIDVFAIALGVSTDDITRRPPAA